MKQITKLADAVVKSAWKYYSIGCAETGKNKNGEGNNIVKCGGSITKFPSGKSGIAWCMDFVDLVYVDALTSLGMSVKNRPINTPDVTTTFNQAKSAGIRIDKNAAIGAILLRSTHTKPSTTTKLQTGTNKTSHVAIIVGITNKGEWVTIEGNTGDRVNVKYYDDPKGFFKKSDHVVLHYEEWGNTSLVNHTLETAIIAKAQTSSSNANDDGDHASNNNANNNNYKNNIAYAGRNVWK